jgi:hypothetical protein
VQVVVIQPRSGTPVAAPFLTGCRAVAGARACRARGLGAQYAAVLYQADANNLDPSNRPAGCNRGLCGQAPDHLPARKPLLTTHRMAPRHRIAARGVRRGPGPGRRRVLAPRPNSLCSNKNSKVMLLTAPRAGLEPAAYCLGGTIATLLDGAACGCMCHSSAPIIAGRCWVSPDACGRWLPVWLSGISLAPLTFWHGC